MVASCWLLGACQHRERAAADLAAPQPTAPSSPAPQRPDGRGQIRIAITADGFLPERTHVTVHEPVTLTVTRLVENTCAKELVLEQFGILVALPLGEPVTVQFTPTEPGPIRFTCTLNGVAGEIVAD